MSGLLLIYQMNGCVNLLKLRIRVLIHILTFRALYRCLAARVRNLHLISFRQRWPYGQRLFAILTGSYPPFSSHDERQYNVSRHGTRKRREAKPRYYSFMDELSEGQIVELKSGGPKMTVKYIDGPNAVCIWSSGEKLSEKSFPSSSLIPAQVESLSDKQLEDILRKSEKRD